MIWKTLSDYLVKLSRAETQYSSTAYLPEHESDNMSHSTANIPDSKSQTEGHKSGDEVLISSNDVHSRDASQDGDDVPKDVAPMGTKKALIAWLILCYSVCPTTTFCVSIQELIVSRPVRQVLSHSLTSRLLCSP